MNIFISGGCGLIGSHLFREFVFNNKVSLCDNLISGYRDNLPPAMTFYGTIERLLNKTLTGVDLVFHTAALPHEGFSIFSPSIIANSVYFNTINLAAKSIAAKVPVFINFSSISRYGDIAPPFRESDCPQPLSPYGMSKFHAEQQLNLLSDIYGLKVIHLVPHSVIGIGQQYDDPRRNVVAITINRALMGEDIVIYGDGKQRRSFSSVNDCINSVVSLISNLDRISNKEIFNIGPDKNDISINDLMDMIIGFTKSNSKIVYLPAIPKEVKNAWCSSDKAKDILGYECKEPLEKTIKDMVEWIKKRGPLPFSHCLEVEIVSESIPSPWIAK